MVYKGCRVVGTPAEADSMVCTVEKGMKYTEFDSSKVEEECSMVDMQLEDDSKVKETLVVNGVA